MTKATCSVDSCAKLVKAKGYCPGHYQRLIEGREVAGPLVRMASVGACQAFIQFAVAHRSDDCLIWPFAKNDRGYGRVFVNGKAVYAHRRVLELAAGPPFPGAHAAHAPVVCHNPSCVNPRHLRWATAAENMADMDADGTSIRARRS